MLPLLLFTLLLDPQEKPPEKCVVSGTVVDAVTEKPLAKVEIELRPLERADNHTAVTRTDSHGGFTMVDLDPGAYRLAGMRSGYLQTFYGARRHGSEGAILRLPAGQRLPDLNLKLAPASVIAGRVRDPESDPVAEAHVVLARRTGAHVRPRIEALDSTDADDEGAYRFSGLGPGTYYVLVEMKPGGWDKVDHSPAGSAPRDALVQAYYPGVPDATMASAIELRAGERREGIDVTLPRMRVFSVRGRVLNAPEMREAVTLRSLRDEGLHDLDPHTATKNSVGEFEFRGVPPGSYVVMGAHSAVPVEVGQADVVDVKLIYGQAAEVQGRVTVEGPDAPPLRNFGISLSHNGRGAMWEFDSDGTLSGRIAGLDVSRRLEPGVYDVEFVRAPKNYYVKSVRSGQRDVLTERLLIPFTGVVPVEVVLAGDGGRVEGAVADDDDRPGIGATVVLVPEPRLRSRLDLFRTATTDQYGRYAFEAVPPGDYSVFAWDDVEDGDWTDPEFLRKHEKDGAKVTVAPKQSASVNAKLLVVIP